MDHFSHWRSRSVSSLTGCRAALRFVHHMTLLYSRPHNACVVPGGAAVHITPGARLPAGVGISHDVA